MITARCASIVLALALPSLCMAQDARPSDARPPARPSLVDDDPSAHQPVDPAVADRGALAAPARVMPYELALPQEFDRVFRVPGNSGKFYRASGALYAVFDEAVYRRGKDGQRIADVPPGTVYYIGRPDWTRVPGISTIEAGSVMEEAHRSSQRESERSASLRAESGSHTRTGEGDRAGAVDEVDSAELEPPVEFASTHHDVAATTGRLPAGVDRSLVVGEGSDVRPRFTVDLVYRQHRLAGLFQMALSQRVRE